MGLMRRLKSSVHSRVSKIRPRGDIMSKGRVRVLTHLQLIFSTSHELLHSLNKCIRRIPPREGRLSKVRVHQMLHTPRVRVIIAVGRELSPDCASMGPVARSGTCYGAFACIFKSDEMILWDEARDEDVPLLVVKLLQLRDHGADKPGLLG